MNSFNTLPVNGTWSLFVTDLSSGGTQQLSGWSMEMTAVPEPQNAGAAAALVLLVAAIVQRRRVSKPRRVAMKIGRTQKFKPEYP